MVKVPAVYLVERSYIVSGHGGKEKKRSFEIYLNDVRLRGFSEAGNMVEGYWGDRAKKCAEDYAGLVAATLAVPVTKVRAK